MNAKDLSFQKWLTGFFVAGYFTLIFAFIGLTAVLIIALIGALWEDAPEWASIDLPIWAAALIAWLQGIIGTLVGVLTGAVKDQIHFWYGSSIGSKSKDRPQQQELLK